MSRKEKGILYYISVAAIFIALEVAALSMSIGRGSMQGSWFARSSHSFMSGVWGSIESVGAYFRLREENRELARKNDSLFVSLMRYVYIDDLLTSSERLPAGLDENFTYIPAVITKASSGTQHNYIIIDKGSLDGVVNHSGIITDCGAIGIIDAVSEHYSYARSLLNSDMVVSARVGLEGAVGSLRWNGRGSRDAIMSDIPQHIEITRGDTIYTSGYSDVFPPDIPLGTIMGWKIRNGATYEIDVRLMTDFRKLRYVYVSCPKFREEILELERQNEK